jgi:hypothetical protein
VLVRRAPELDPADGADRDDEGLRRVGAVGGVHVTVTLPKPGSASIRSSLKREPSPSSSSTTGEAVPRSSAKLVIVR